MEDYYPDPDQLLWLFVFRILFAVFCIFVNTFLLVVFIFSKNYRQSFHNWLTTMMAVADIIVGVGIFSRITVYISGYPRTSDGYDRTVCLTFAIPQILGIQWNQSILAHMAKDRLKAIKDPTHYVKASFTRESIRIFTEWIISGIIVLLVIFLTLPSGRSVQCSTGSIASHGFLYAYVVVGVLKGVYVLAIYYRALKELKTRVKNASTQTANNVQTIVFKRVSILLLFYITLCVLPLFLVLISVILNLNENIIAYDALLVAIFSEIFSVFSFFVLSWKNREMNSFIQKYIFRKKQTPTCSTVRHSHYTKPL